jgi:hypothetical protein
MAVIRAFNALAIAAIGGSQPSMICSNVPCVSEAAIVES